MSITLGKWLRFGRPAVTDERSFERLVLPHLDSAMNVARWLVRDASLAEDVVQDSMLRALKYFAGFQGEDARAWLLQIVRNASYGALAARKQQTLRFVDDEEAVADAPDEADDPEAALGRCQDLQLLERTLAALPAELRECLVLRELEGCSYKEIAGITGMPIGTVMSRLWRARQALMAPSKGTEP